jgi:hypothetical protein
MINYPITREQFYSMIPRRGTLLEIGPYASPTFRRPDYDVYYADVVTPAQIRSQCSAWGYIPDGTPDHIDILIRPMSRPTFTTDLKFKSIFSSHNIEHHPDLINHLLEMAAVADGKDTEFFLAIPDKRYCFDHYQRESSCAEIIGAHVEDRRKHVKTSFIQTEVYKAHNDQQQHWDGNHGPDPWNHPLTPDRIAHLKDIIAKSAKMDNEYVDTHAWRFTMNSFLQCMEILSALDLQPWVVDRIYEPIYCMPEFYAVLKLK